MRIDQEFATPFLRIAEADATPMAVSLAQKYPPFRPRGHTSGVPPIPGGGPAQAYLRAAPKHVAALLMFCAEGDNRGDAQELALRAADLCGEPLAGPLAEPPSWACLFGGAPEPLLYS